MRGIHTLACIIALSGSALAQPRWLDSPELRAAAPDADGRLHLLLLLTPGASPFPLAQQLADQGSTLLRIRVERRGARIQARVPASALEGLAALGQIAWLEPVHQPTLRNWTTRWVIQSNVQDSLPVWDHGLHGEGQILGHLDYPLDLEHCLFRDSVPPGPDHRKLVRYRVKSQSYDAHGTHTAATAAGWNGTSTYAAGMAYAARLSHTDVRYVTGYGNSTANLDELLLADHEAGARIHTNSWGDDSSTLYNTLAHDIDAFSYDHEEDLVIFAASNQATLRSPENAKDVLAVGASKQAPEQGSFCYGGTGPTTDGRRKPEIFAPGCGIVSASVGTECGLSVKSGTSMASPAVAGAAALARQYFQEGFLPGGRKSPADAFTPSGALLRAVLINSAVDMPGVEGYPSDQEGWGRLLLDNVLYFEGDARRLMIRDVRNGRGLEPGQAASVHFRVTSSELPLRATLAFTDPPGAAGAEDPVINDLDLELDGPAGTVLPVGGPDPRNTVEQILLDPPAVGDYTLRVQATAIRQGKQGYALAVTGAIEDLDPPPPILSLPPGWAGPILLGLALAFKKRRFRWSEPHS